MLCIYIWEKMLLLEKMLLNFKFWKCGQNLCVAKTGFHRPSHILCVSFILEQIYVNGETTIVPEQEKLQLHGKNTNENLDDEAKCNVEVINIHVYHKYIKLVH